MSKYYLKLGEMTVPRVSKLIVTHFYRAESRQTTLSGGLAVDRGDVKKRLEINIKIMSAAELRELERVLDTIVTTAEFYYLDEHKTINVVADPILSKDEIYLYGKRENGVYYANIRFTLEEQ